MAVISCLAGIILCTYATFYEGSLAPSNHALAWLIAASEACFYIQSILSMASALTSWLLMSSRSCFCSCLCMGVECICGGVDKPVSGTVQGECSDTISIPYSTLSIWEKMTGVFAHQNIEMSFLDFHGFSGEKHGRSDMG